MEYRQLGRSGLMVSALSFGTMTLGGDGGFAKMGSSDRGAAMRQVDACLDAGINLLDTADAYAQSEEVLGEILQGRRARWLVATKARFARAPGVNAAGLSRHHLIEACEDSLRRLRTDHIDLYQLHGWDGRTPVEETLGALDHLLAAGKIRYVGVSNFSAWHVMKMIGAAAAMRSVAPVAQQVHYSLANRDIEQELVPLAIDQGLGILAWSPLSGGLLSGKYRQGEPAPAGARGSIPGADHWTAESEARIYRTIDELTGIATERGVAASAVALAWVLARPQVASIIVGARDERQLTQNLAAAELTLSAEELDRLERASRPPLLYPYWHQLRHASDRLAAADLSLLGPYL